MIITIRVTEAAIEHIKQETGLDEEDAGELAQILVGLYEVKGSPDPDYKLPEKSSEREDRLEAVIWEGFQVLKRYGVNILRYRMDGLPKAIEEAANLPGPRLRRAAQDVVNLSHKSTTAESLFEAIGRLEQALRALPEGEGSEDLLFKTAHYLMTFYAVTGAKVFRARFGSLDILGPCHQIIKEGEGNPHPWHGPVKTSPE